MTILPAGQALGVTEQLPLVERHLYGEDYLDDMLAVRLGGRASELVVLGQGSTGAANDLAKATDLATKMVREFGLSAALGPVGLPDGRLGVPRRRGRPSSPAGPSPRPPRPPSTPRSPSCCGEAEDRAVSLLKAHRDVLDRLVQLLVANETVDGTEIYALAGRPAPTGLAGVTVAPGERVAADARRPCRRAPASAAGLPG